MERVDIDILTFHSFTGGVDLQYKFRLLEGYTYNTSFVYWRGRSTIQVSFTGGVDLQYKFRLLEG